MTIKEDPNAPRGPGEARFDRMLQLRAPKKLVNDEQMLYEHALRCFCSLCGSLLNWECPEDVSYTETECCGLRYHLQPWTVKVRIDDVSSRPILPKLEGSGYSDPAFELSGHLVGDLRTFMIPARSVKKGRRCGICRAPGHTRKNCPETRPV